MTGKFVIRVCIMGIALGAATAASAARNEEDANAARDRAAFERLLGQRQEVCRKYERAVDDGKQELKEHGQVNVMTQDAVLRLRSESDRIETRLITLALRHGWEVPEASDGSGSGRKTTAERELENVFGTANVLIKGELQRDTERLSTQIQLPVRPLPVRGR